MFNMSVSEICTEIKDSDTKTITAPFRSLDDSKFILVALRHNSTVTRLDLRGSHIDAHLLRTALQWCHTIKHLDISNCTMHNAKVYRGQLVFRVLPVCGRLHSIDLRWAKFNERSPRLGPLFRHNNSLRHAKVDPEPFGERAIRNILKCNTITHIDDGQSLKLYPQIRDHLRTNIIREFYTCIAPLLACRHLTSASSMHQIIPRILAFVGCPILPNSLIERVMLSDNEQNQK